MNERQLGFPPLSQYFLDAASTEAELLIEQPRWVALIHKVDDLWRSQVFGFDVKMAPTPTLLCYHGFAMWAAAARVAMSGHAAAVYPLLRTALEAASYGFAIARDESLEKLWHERSTHSKASRKAFSDVMKKVPPQVGEPLASLCIQSYQALIDFGAHPNVRGVMDYSSKTGETPDGLEVMTFAVINNTSSIQLVRALNAVVDVGMVTLAVVTCVPNSHPRASNIEELTNAMFRDEIAPLVGELNQGPIA